MLHMSRVIISDMVFKQLHDIVCYCCYSVQLFADLKHTLINALINMMSNTHKTL